MNANFTLLYNAVVQITGYRNQHELITQTISNVTAVAHGERKYYADSDTFEWTNPNIETAANNYGIMMPGLINNPCGSGSDEDQTEVTIDLLDLGGIRGIAFLTVTDIDGGKRVFSGSYDSAREVIAGPVADCSPYPLMAAKVGNNLIIKGKKVIASVSLSGFKTPSVLPDNYDSWIGNGYPGNPYSAYIVHEAAAQVIDEQGGHNARTHFSLAEKARRYLFADQEHYN